MRYFLLIPGLVFSMGLNSCGNGEVAPKSTPEPPASNVMDTPPPGEAMAASGMTVAAVDPLGLPPPDTSCTADADCTVASRPRVEDGFCCHGCAHFPVNRSWWLAAVGKCNRFNEGKTPGCPKLDCSDVPDAVCLEGKCRFRR